MTDYAAEVANPSPITVLAHQPPRFDISNETEANEMLDYLNTHGYVIVAGVASPEQIEMAKDDFWAFTSEVTPSVKRDNPNTWQGKDWFADEATGIHNRYGLNHHKFTWNTRLLPGVKKAFAKIWGSDELIVSYDAGNVFRPWKYNPDWVTKGGWWHVDQNHFKPNRQGRVTVQGVVTYYDANEETGGLCVIPGSHLHHAEVCGRVKYVEYSGDYVPVKKGDPIFESAQAVLLCAKAGDLILWDSRTVHCNTPALTYQAFKDSLPPKVEDNSADNKTLLGENAAASAAEDELATKFDTPLSSAVAASTLEPVELLRLCAYVCMVPRSHANKAMLDSRKGAFINRVGTSHYPAQYLQHGFPIKNGVDPSKCSKEMLELVGYQANYWDAIFNPGLAEALRGGNDSPKESRESSQSEGAEPASGSEGKGGCVVM